MEDETSSWWGTRDITVGREHHTTSGRLHKATNAAVRISIESVKSS